MDPSRKWASSNEEPFKFKPAVKVQSPCITITNISVNEFHVSSISQYGMYVCIRQTHFDTTFSVKRKFYVPPFRDSVTVPILPRLDNIPDDGDMLTLEVWTHDNAETINGIPRHILRDVWSNTGKDCYKRRQRLHCTDKLKLGGLVPYTEDDFVGVIYNNPDAEGLQLRTTHYPPLFIRDSKSTLVVCGYCRYVYQSQAEYAKCCGYEYFLMGLSGVKSQYLE